MSIRMPAVAGTFYPKNRKELEKTVEQFLKGKKSSLPGKLKALIVPHAGYIYSGSVAGKAFQALATAGLEKEPEIWLMGPSHTIPFRGASISLSDEWETPLGKVPTSRRGNEFLSPFIINLEEAHLQEHCLEVQVPFLQQVLPRFSILPIVIGMAEAELLAIELEPKIASNTFIIASSDLSHYLPYAKAVIQDKKTIQDILSMDPEKMETDGDACGKTAIEVLMRLAKEKGWKPTLLEYKNSGDTAGDKKAVVGYAAIAFTEE